VKAARFFVEDTTGFSLWYFNFALQNYSHSDATPPGFSRWYFNFPGEIRIVRD